MDLLVALKAMDGSTVARAFFNNMICTNGCQESLLSDPAWKSNFSRSGKRVVTDKYIVFLPME